MRSKMAQPWLRTLGTLCTVLCLGAVASAQATHNQPVTDSSVEASPLKPAPHSPIYDASAEASPITPANANGAYVVPHTPINIRLNNAIDSGRLQNGETVHATLAEPVTLSPQGSLSAGTPAELTVVETLPAGRFDSAGEFSLQLLRIGTVSVYTDTLTYRGQPGHKDLPDSAPTVGTDAGLPSGATLVFHVLPNPEPANGEPQQGRSGPGSINGVAGGSAPPSSQSTNGNGSQNQGNGGVAPNPPPNSTPADGPPPR
jgi:hypothetical protein